MSTSLNARTIVDWILSVIFIVLGILNAFLIHIVPGIFYLVLSTLYLPPITEFIEQRWGLRIPFIIRIIVALVILWATLAVGELIDLI